MASDSHRPNDPPLDPNFFPDPDAPAHVSRRTGAAIPPRELRNASQPEPHNRLVVMTRMQAWEQMDRAQHKVDRLRAHYEAALAKGDLPLADALATDLFEADVAFRKTENRYGRFVGKIPYGRQSLARTTASKIALFVLIMLMIPCTFFQCVMRN